MMEKKKIVIATLTFMAVLLSMMIPARGLTTQPNIFVDPVVTNASVTSGNFTVNVNVTDASGVSGYGINLRFDPVIMVCSGYQSGGFMATSGVAVGPVTFTNNSGIGYVSLGDTLSAAGSASGNGTLVKITFVIREGGRCALHLYDTGLYDENNMAISHTDADGQFILNYVSLMPSTGTAGFMIQGFGFGSDATITSVTWNGTALPIMPTQCDIRGNFVTPGIVPDISTPGNYTISVLDSSGNINQAVFTLTAATGLTGPTGPKGDKGDTGSQGPAGTGGTDMYSWAALALSIVAIIIGIYAAMRKKS